MNAKRDTQRLGHGRLGRRHLAGTAVLAIGLAAGAACGGSTEELVSAAPEAPSPELLQQLNTEAGSAWAARVAVAGQYAEIHADEAVRARVERAAGSDRHLETMADEAQRAMVAQQAGSDRHLETLASS
jgi:hypothetical protein